MNERGESSLHSTEVGRRATWAGFTGLASRSVSILVLAVTLPLALETLGEERFGLWMLITSLAMSFGFLDLGLANGMLTSLAEATGEAPKSRVREVLATGVLLLTALGAAILLLSGAIVPFIDWHSALNVTAAIDPDELKVAMIALLSLIAIGIPASAVQKIYFGLQRGAQANFWQAAGGLISLAGILAAAKAQAGLPGFVAASVGGPVLGWLFGGVALLVGRNALPVPSISLYNKTEARQLARDALLYLTLQLSAALALYSDNALLAAARGTSELASFSTTARVFGLVSLTASIMAYPLWAAFGLAAGRGNYEWIFAQFRKVLLKTILFAVITSAVLALVFDRIVHLWLGASAPDFPVNLVMAFALWTVLQSAGAVISSLLNALRAMRLQACIALAFTPICVWLKWRLALQIGPVGIVLAASVSYVAIALVPYAIFVRRWFKCASTQPRHTHGL